MASLNKIKKKIQESDRIVVVAHINPDGDTIGSLLSLGLGLQQLKKKVDMVCSDMVPRVYQALPGADQIIRNVASLSADYDLAITVDCCSQERLGKAYKVIRTCPEILEIDHHEYREPFGTIGFIDMRAAAVGEMIYVLLKALGVVFTKEIAQNILTSIMVETDSFRLPTVRLQSFEISTRLLKTGVDFAGLTDILYRSRKKAAAILASICMSRCLFLKNSRIVWSIVRLEDFIKIKGKQEDVDDVADMMRSINGVEVSVLFRESDGSQIRVSVRARGGINVANVARQYGGGGHINVAGCSIPNTRKDMRAFLRSIETCLNKNG